MKTALCGVMLAWSAAASAACDYPPLVAIPAADDIGDAVAEVLVDMQRYVNGMAEYVACLQDEIAAAGGEGATAVQKAAFINRHNSAVSEAKTVTDLFTARVARIDALRYAELVDSDHEECIAAERIESTAVVDDRVVLFHRRGGRGVYLNILEASCPGLEANRFFSYQTQMRAPVRGLAEVGIAPPEQVLNRVCHTDFIYTPAPRAERSVRTPCALGWFFPISDEQATSLLQPADVRTDIVIVPHEPE